MVSRVAAGEVVQSENIGVPAGDLPILAQSKFAVLVIDVHKGHIGGRATVPVPNGARILKPLKHFLREARVMELPVIHVMFRARANGLDIQINPFWRSVNVLKDRPKMAVHNIESSESELLIKPSKNDYLIDTKKRYNCFYGTDLEILLRSLKVDGLILTGLTADCCVMNTAFEAFNRDLKTIVLSDCTETVYSEDKEAALRIVARRIGWVLSSTQALALLTRSKPP
ncbi:MAG: cysteine hydrolase [Thaumarchaeota archaeon]|nr:cysteine hydrolase [Nitrososphaerota archaeon]